MIFHTVICILHHLQVYYELTMWPAPSWLDSSVGRALHWYGRGHGFDCVYNCDDHLCLHLFLRSSNIIMIFHLFFYVNSVCCISQNYYGTCCKYKLFHTPPPHYSNLSPSFFKRSKMLPPSPTPPIQRHNKFISTLIPNRVLYNKFTYLWKFMLHNFCKKYSTAQLPLITYYRYIQI